ncbi:PREDICTED: uncharacterized protein LOC105624826 [Atta cephalotes]|uniref:Uncharacterized protein n=1 Tax=Atta cephalotes TaxID=12957 RepID=A0A158NVL0_ATTCE|nr:PREDICTED: uncharacterized protein LOC105624826 [Atta cephalotes]
MKNQCPQYIRKRTMKMQTRIILTGCFVIMIFNNFSTSVKVSSKVDLDSNENEETLDNPTFTILNFKKSANSPESILRTSNPSTLIWHQGNEFVKEPRKRRIYTLHENSAKQPKIINNIQVVVNNNDSIPNENSCKYSICNVSISSKSDEKGNIVTEVYFSIITKAKPNIKIDDVPVINGFRGINEDYEQPIFHSINSPRSIDAHLYFNNIPQVQSNYHEYNEPRYGRTFRQPHQMNWNYHFGNHDNVKFRDHNTWVRDRPIVDDKIEPPLSKTKLSDDTY